MGEGFVKLYEDILDSSVWCLDAETRLVWVTMLAMANKDGLVHAAVPGIANRARVSLEATRKAIEIFQSPDPDSRSTNKDGKRIERVGRDWLILNYGAHRERGRQDAIKASKRKWWNENRGKDAGLEPELEQPRSDSGKTRPIQKQIPNAEADSDPKEEKKEKNIKKRKSGPSPDFMDFWASWPASKIGRADAWKKWEALRKSGDLPPVDKLKQILIQQDLARGTLSRSGGFVPPWPNPSTWLNQGRWDDEIKVDSTHQQSSGPMTQQDKNMAILKAGREKRAAERRKQDQKIIQARIQ